MFNEEEEGQAFETCLLNCSYAEQQLELENEEQTQGKSNMRGNVHEVTMKEIEMGDGGQEFDTISMDDKSLLDCYDSSGSWDKVNTNC